MTQPAPRPVLRQAAAPRELALDFIDAARTFTTAAMGEGTDAEFAAAEHGELTTRAAFVAMLRDHCRLDAGELAKLLGAL